MSDAYGKCDAYDAFHGLHEQILSKYKCLKWLQIKEESRAEFIRGGIVAMMSAWESYVHDLFNEGFDTLVTVCSGPERSLERLKKQWPECDKIIFEAMKSEEDYKGYKVLEETDLVCEKFWVGLLNTHRRNLLDRRTLKPIFNYMTAFKDKDAMSIDEMFTKVFGYKKQKMSDMVVEVAGSDFFLLCPGNLKVTLGSETPTMKKAAVRALYNISRLYYGLRCVFVDGKKEKAVKGTLDEFPDSEKKFNLPTQEDGGENEKAEKYITLCKQLKENGRHVKVDYETFLSVTDFVSFAAKYLKQAVAKWVYDLQPQDTTRAPVWGYSIAPSATASPN